MGWLILGTGVIVAGIVIGVVLTTLPSTSLLDWLATAGTVWCGFVLLMTRTPSHEDV